MFNFLPPLPAKAVQSAWCYLCGATQRSIWTETGEFSRKQHSCISQPSDISLLYVRTDAFTPDTCVEHDAHIAMWMTICFVCSSGVLL